MKVVEGEKFMKHATKIFKILANEKRLKILRLLIDSDELSVGQIAEELKMPLVTVSRHLEKLRSGELVKFREDGLKMYYSLAEPQNSLTRILISLIQKI